MEVYLQKTVNKGIYINRLTEEIMVEDPLQDLLHGVCERGEKSKLYGIALMSLFEIRYLLDTDNQLEGWYVKIREDCKKRINDIGRSRKIKVGYQQ